MSTTTQVSSKSRSQYKAKAYSAAGAKSPLAPTTIPRRDPAIEVDMPLDIINDKERLKGVENGLVILSPQA